MGRPAVSDLIAAFQELYILYNQPAFTLPEGASGSKLLKSPKIRFSDPSLAIAANHADSLEELLWTVHRYLPDGVPYQAK